jgi:O-antigen/teichoic acid export membrane protein
MTKILNMPFQLEKKPWPLIRLLSWSAVANLAVNLVLLPLMGARGAVIATVISFAAYFFMSLVSVRKLFPGVVRMAMPGGIAQWLMTGICATYGVLSVWVHFNKIGTFQFTAAAVCTAVSGSVLLPQVIKYLQARKTEARVAA